MDDVVMDVGVVLSIWCGGLLMGLAVFGGMGYPGNVVNGAVGLAVLFREVSRAVEGDSW